MSDVSVVIVTYNSEEVIRRCLESVLIQELGGKAMEVIVVDNASTDDTKKTLARYSSQISVVKNENNKGFAAAANQGALTAQGSLLLFLNPDTYLAKGAIKKMCDFFYEHTNASIAGFRLLNADGTKQRSCWKKPNLGTLAIEMLLPYNSSLLLVTELPEGTSPVHSVSGAFMGVRRNDFLNLEGFDERFFMYYEDIDLCVRALDLGLNIYYYPEAEAIHEIGASSWKNMATFFERFYTSKFFFFRKHYPPFISSAAFFMLLVGIILRVGVYYVLGILFGREHFLILAKGHRRALWSLLRKAKK